MKVIVSSQLISYTKMSLALASCPKECNFLSISQSKPTKNHFDVLLLKIMTLLLCTYRPTNLWYIHLLFNCLYAKNKVQIMVPLF